MRWWFHALAPPPRGRNGATPRVANRRGIHRGCRALRAEEPVDWGSGCMLSQTFNRALSETLTSPRPKRPSPAYPYYTLGFGECRIWEAEYDIRSAGGAFSAETQGIRNTRQRAGRADPKSLTTKTRRHGGACDSISA